MFKLVVKDFRITRLFWGPAAFSYLVFLFMAYELAWIMLLVGIVLVPILCVLILLIDDLHRTEPLYGALPVTRRDTVLARFLTTGIITAVCLALFYLATEGISGLLDEKGSHLQALLTPRTGLVFVVAIAILMALFFPIFFRHGLGKAVVRFPATVLGGSIVLMALLRLLEPGLLAYINKGKDGGEAWAGTGPVLIVPLLSKIESDLGRAVFAGLVLAGTALAVVFSARLSLRFYKRRDL